MREGLNRKDYGGGVPLCRGAPYPRSPRALHSHRYAVTVTDTTREHPHPTPPLPSLGFPYPEMPSPRPYPPHPHVGEQSNKLQGPSLAPSCSNPSPHPKIVRGRT